MIYLDNGATSFPKPPQVVRAAARAIERCANPGRGGYGAAMRAARLIYESRERAAKLFGCQPEQVVFTPSCTYGLNAAIRSLVSSGDKIAVSGFEHNAVTRALHAQKARLLVCGRRLFDWEDTLKDLKNALENGAKCAVFTHVSNVFGYILPIQEVAALCRRFGAKLIIDAAQSAGMLPLNMADLGADFIAMPGHKGLLGPQGIGLLLCAGEVQPLVMGGTGSESRVQTMPEYLPERMEAGTMNVPGIGGLLAGMELVSQKGVDTILRREQKLAKLCADALHHMGMEVFAGEHQSGTVSFRPGWDCEDLAEKLSGRGIAVRAGLHCAPLAHESAGTLDTGTVRVSFGHASHHHDLSGFLTAMDRILWEKGHRS